MTTVAKRPAYAGVSMIVSGAQAGADRGGLDAALALGIPHGGWMPKGRRAEDGVIPAQYDQLFETESAAYDVRTRMNVLLGDGTVIFTLGRQMTPGSALTARLANEMAKPWLHVWMSDPPDRAWWLHTFRIWLKDHQIETLNVAGSRESKAPGIQAAVCDFLTDALCGFPA